jgi:hypothetical protein
MLTGANRDRRRHLRTYVAIAAAAGVIAGAGAITGWHVTHQAGARPAAAAPAWAPPSRAANPRTGVRATVKYAAKAWGLQLAVQVTGIPAGTTCELDVVNRQGRNMTAGGWIIAGGRTHWYPASSSVGVADIRGFAVVSGSTTLVQVPIDASGGR